ncbi:MAG: GNAT family N-acetyltransferase [Pseudobutyrivibrio sp.]|nr:GNAT family N-acetyltransferase [Pseudobutyrivibrio sp.]
MGNSVRVKLIDEYSALPESREENVLYVSDRQDVLDECKRMGFPVAAYEHDGIIGLDCPHILMDLDQVEDETFLHIYRRCLGLPLEVGQTDRTILREFSMDRLDDLFDLYSKEGITDFMDPLFDYEEEKEYEANYITFIYKVYGFGMWLVFDKTTGELIGRAGIEIRESCDRKNQAELGFCITPERWGQGLAFEVCSKIIELAKEEFQLESLIARCDPGNLRSIGLLKKLGFEHVGNETDGDMRFFRWI